MSPSTDPVVVFDGQSLNFVPSAGLTYPEQTMAPLGVREWWNIGYSGKSWTVLKNGDGQVAAASVRMPPKYGTSRPTIGVLNGGQSDIFPASENQTGAAAYADLLSYCGLMRGYGCDRIIVTTMGPSSAFGAQEQARLDYNTLVRAGNAAYDTVVDLANVPQLMNPLDATMYSDQLHYTALGASYAAAAVRPAIVASISALGGS